MPRGRYFDGRSAAPREVQLLPLPGVVCLRGEGFERREALADVDIGEQLGSAPRLIRFTDGAMCEVIEDGRLAEWLDAIGYRSRAVDLAQRSGWIAALSVILVLAAGFAGYRWGLPLAAAELARRTPAAVTQELSEQTLKLLDSHLLQASKLDAARRAQLTAAFGQLDAQGEAELLFRAGPAIGPNALALPDGRIVLIDELVAIARHDEEVLAVLAHELGHVQGDHGLRQMIQGAVVAAFIAWWIGDFSPLITGAPAAILQARHSRALEREADARAATMLRAQGISPARLADMLARIAAAHGERVDAGKNQDDGGWSDYLSSHPATRERVQALRGERDSAD